MGGLGQEPGSGLNLGLWAPGGLATFIAEKGAFRGNFYERQRTQSKTPPRGGGVFGEQRLGVVVGRGLTSSEMGTQRQLPLGCALTRRPYVVVGLD